VSCLGLFTCIERAADSRGGGGAAVGNTRATGINPVTYNNNINHLATLGHYWVTNATQHDQKK